MTENQEVKIQWNYLLLLSSAYFATSINMQGIQALMPFIQADFNLSRTQAGLYTTFFFISATAAAVFSGNIVDDYGARKGMLIGVFSVGGMMILHSFAPVYTILLLFALICGFGFSIITPSVNKAIIEGVDQSKRAISMGIMQSGGGIGGFVGASLLPLFAENFGWRKGIALSGVLAIAVGVVIIIFLKEQNSYSSTKSEQPIFSRLKKLLENKDLFLLCLLGLGFGTAIGSIPAHFALFLTLDLGFSAAAAGLSLGILQIGGIVGRPFWGIVSDKVFSGKRDPALKFLIAAIITMLVVFGLFIWRMADYTWLIFLFSFLLGMTGMGWMGLYFTFIGESVGSEKTGLATGLALIFLRAGVIVSPPIFGLIADISGNYNLSWLVLAFTIFLIGLIYFQQKRFMQSGKK